MEPKSGWNLPPGLMAIPEEKERVWDPNCSRCQGEGVYDYDMQVHEGGVISSVCLECDCWESYDPGDCDSRHEYNHGE